MRVYCAAAVALPKNPSLLALVPYAATVVVLWQKAPALIIFGFLSFYRAACCLLLTALVAVLTRSGQKLGRCHRPVVGMPTPNT